MAGDVNGFNGKNTFGIKAEFLARFFEEGMGLVRDVVRSPAFSPEEAEKIRPELLAQLRQQEDSLPALAMREVNRLLYRDHPYALNTAGDANAINALTAADLLAMYNKHAQPETMVLAIAGDVQPQTVYDVTRKLFGDWHPDSAGVSDSSFAVPKAPEKPVLQNVERAKAQTHIIISFLGTTLNSDDRIPLELLDALLSGQSGRLFSYLRDQESLAYSLSSFSLLGLDTGAFGIYIGTSPDKKDKAVQAIWEQLQRVRSEKVGEAELQRAKNALIGQYELSLQTHGSQAMDMALLETYDLGLDHGSRYLKKIEAASAQEVLAAARKYIQPEHYVMVSVGAQSPE